MALNAARAADESRGVVRWLRPEFQCPAGLATAEAGAERELPLATATAAAGPKPAWPKTLPEQFQVLRAALAEQAARGGPVGIDQLAQAFARAPRAKVAELLDTLAALGHACRWTMAATCPGNSAGLGSPVVSACTRAAACRSPADGRPLTRCPLRSLGPRAGAASRQAGQLPEGIHLCAQGRQLDLQEGDAVGLGIRTAGA